MLEQLTPSQLGLIGLGIYIGIRLLIEIERYAKRKVFNNTPRDRRSEDVVDNPSTIDCAAIAAQIVSLEKLLCEKLDNIKAAITDLKKGG